MQGRGEKIWKCPQYILSSVNLAKLKLLSTQFIHASTQISALQSQQQTIEIKDFKIIDSTPGQTFGNYNKSSLPFWSFNVVKQFGMNKNNCYVQ